MKELIILGCHNKTSKYVPEGVEVWTIPFMVDIEQTKKLNITKVFEIHRKTEYIQDTYEMIQKTKHRVVLQKPDKKVKNYELYPFKDIFKKYGEYFTNSISLMLAYAVESGYKKIGIFGVEFEGDREYTIERPNIEYWTGYFRAQGIDIYSPKQSILFRSKYVYGIDNILAFIDTQKKRINELDDMYLNLMTKYLEEKDKDERTKISKKMNVIQIVKWEAEYTMRTI